MAQPSNDPDSTDAQILNGWTAEKWSGFSRDIESVL